MAWEEVTIGQCRLIRADAREILPTLEAVDALITDPPYGVLAPGDLHRKKRDTRGGQHGLKKASYAGYADTYHNFCTTVVPILQGSIKLARRAAVFTGPHIQEQPKATALGGIYIPAGAGRHEWGFKTFLPILFYGVAPQLSQGAKPNTLMSTAIAEHHWHPCPKPLAWMRWLVSLASCPGEMVLDPFAGSFTTGIACMELGRSFIGIELDPGYWELSCRRIEQAYAQPDFFVVPSPPPRQLGMKLT